MARMTQRPRIGAILREGMRRKGLNQVEAAEAIGVSRSALNAWINDRAWPQEDKVAAVEAVLDVELPRWWADDPVPEDLGSYLAAFYGLPMDSGEVQLRESLARLYEQGYIGAATIKQSIKDYRAKRRAVNPAPASRAS